MKIKKIKINGYGNIQNKEIELKDNINILYGENESGKSTMFKFINNMLYGCAKTKRGQDISDFEKYKPWNLEEFSGNINYELDNKNKYEVFRNFNTKNPQIYNEYGDDISKEFNVNKTTGINYFYEQTGVDEELFLESVAVLQGNSKLENDNQNILIQKITNIANTGEENISYKKVIQNIKEKQMQEIGTERSVDRPINKIINEINNLKKQEKEITIYENEINNINEKKDKIKFEIKRIEKEINILKNLKNIIQENEIEKEKIKLKEEIILKNKEEIENLNIEKNNLQNEIVEVDDSKKYNVNKKMNILFLILFFISIFLHIFLKNNLFIISHTIFFILIIITIFKNIKGQKIKEEKRIEIKNLNRNKRDIENKIEIINKNLQEEKIKIDLIKNNYKNKINIEKEKIINENNFFDMDINFLNYENIEKLLEEKQEEYNNKKIEIEKVKIIKNQINEKKEKEVYIKERLNYLEEEYNNLKDKNKSYEIAKQSIENAYIKMRENVAPKFLEILSKIISEITNNKYNNVKHNIENGLIIQKENGEYISINRLSIGTIDQIYLAFRIAIIKEITNENIPIILDEAFAYYDEERLENILKYLNELENQVIIFTCTNREKNILEKNDLNFNYIKI